MKSHPLPADPSAELASLEHHHELDDAAGSTFERVIWRRSSSLRLHDLDAVGLAATDTEYPSLRAVSVGDPDYWFEKLVQEDGRASRAWVIEITAIEGDKIVDDPQCVMPDIHGHRADSRILVTTRHTLHEGVDYEIVRELDASDFTEEEEDDDFGYSYGDDDGYGDDE